MSAPDPELRRWTIKEIADSLALSETKVHKEIVQGRLTAVRIPSTSGMFKYSVCDSELRAWLQRISEESAPSSERGNALTVEEAARRIERSPWAIHALTDRKSTRL